MAPPTMLNYYEELEVSQTATQQEIVSSYRRLAMQHHPDRNHGDAQASTIKFQRLGEAYDALSEPEKRDRYDRTIATGSSRSASGPSDAGDSSQPFGTSQPDSFPFNLVFGGMENGEPFFLLQVGADTFIRVKGSPTEDRHPMGSARHREAEARRLAQIRAAQAASAVRASEFEERRRRKRDERERKEAEKQAQKRADAADKAAQQKEVEQQLETDREKQEARWEQKKAVTPEQKQAICLHANFWTKIKQDHKVQCGSCRNKRGVFGFKCPYCDVLVCQLCQSQLSEKKRKVEKTL